MNFRKDLSLFFKSRLGASLLHIIANMANYLRAQRINLCRIMMRSQDVGDAAKTEDVKDGRDGNTGDAGDVKDVGDKETGSGNKE